jgi:hypothetical protein
MGMKEDIFEILTSGQDHQSIKKILLDRYKDPELVRCLMDIIMIKQKKKKDSGRISLLPEDLLRDHMLPMLLDTQVASLSGTNRYYSSVGGGQLSRRQTEQIIQCETLRKKIMAFLRKIGYGVRYDKKARIQYDYINDIYVEGIINDPPKNFLVTHPLCVRVSHRMFRLDLAFRVPKTYGQWLCVRNQEEKQQLEKLLKAYARKCGFNPYVVDNVLILGASKN